MANLVSEIGAPKQISASTLIQTGAGSVIGVFCSNAGSTGTSRVALCDKLTSAASVGVGRFVAPFAPTGGTFHRTPMSFGTGLYVSLTGSAQNVTVVWQPA